MKPVQKFAQVSYYFAQVSCISRVIIHLQDCTVQSIIIYVLGA